MKKLGQIFIICVAIFIPLYAAFYGGYRQGRKTSGGTVTYLTNGNYTVTFYKPAKPEVDMELYNAAFNRGVKDGVGCAIILSIADGHCKISASEANNIIMKAVEMMTRPWPYKEWPHEEWPTLLTNRSTNWIGGRP